MEGAEEILERAQSSESTNPAQAEQAYKSIIAQEHGDDEFTRVKEQAIYALGNLFVTQSRATDLGALLSSIRPFFDHIPKAKTAKLVRTLIDLVAKVPNSLTLQIELCKDSIEWCKREKRTFLRQRIQSKLAALLLESEEFAPALSLITDVLKEVKRLDDKPLLVEIQLVESRVHHALRNIPRAKAALTAARTAGNAIYCPPPLQAAIDSQAGTLHAEEKDYKTAYSYFYEAFEAYKSMEDPRAVLSLKYMLLCKIMTNSAEDVHALIDGKHSLKFAGEELESMRSVAQAYEKRSLDNFQIAKAKYSKQLGEDPVINSHLNALYDNLLEHNLTRLVEPFSRVEIAHIAKLMHLDVRVIELKLSQMILDKKFNGILDQGAGALIAYDDAPDDKTYPAALETLQHMGGVVDRLYERAAKL